MEINTALRNAVEFLLFSYFGLCFEDSAKHIVEKALDLGYNDATNQGAYNALNKNDDSESKKNARAQIYEQVDSFFSDNNTEEYDDWHSELCSSLVEKYKKVLVCGNVQAFSYGNAQKWVNMTMKYLYILRTIYESFAPNNEFCNEKYARIKGDAHNLHAPIDRFIINAVVSEFDKDVKLPLCANNKKEIQEYSNPAEHVVPWSSWTNSGTSENNIDGDYNSFQESLRVALDKKDLSRIDWEGPAWIAQAKKEKRKNKKEND